MEDQRRDIAQCTRKFCDGNGRHPDWELDYIAAPPRMARYMQVSAQIYAIYLKYIAPEDIHVYSCDEVFMDVSAYLKTYKMTPHQLAMTMIRDVLKQTGITATAGIGTNMYLCKVAMDIVAKHMPADEDGVRIAELDEQEADFNISNISSKEQETKNGKINYTQFQHQVAAHTGGTDYYDFPEMFESDGTMRTFGLAAHIQHIMKQNAFLAIDEVDNSLHPKLIEYIIERFLKEADRAQMLLTTHYDGLLGEEDLLRKDTIWFTEKNAEGVSSLYPLTDFKGLYRISSLQKAYKFGKFGAIPNL